MCDYSDIFRECESLEMQTGPYVAQWPDRPAPQSHNLSSTYTSQPCKFPVCSQIMLSELITPPTSPPPHFISMASPHMLGHRFSSISWDLESKGNRDAEQPSCDPHVCLSWPYHRTMDCNITAHHHHTLTQSATV